MTHPSQQQLSLNDLTKNTSVKFGTSGVRGLVDELTDEVCAAYVIAFLQQMKTPVRRVMIGSDLRPSSPRMVQACIAAIEACDCQAWYVGQLPTPALAYGCLNYKVPGIMVTGSHIPFDRNGIKFYHLLGEITKADELAIQQACVELPHALTLKALPDVDSKILDQYIQRYLDVFPGKPFEGKTVAVYEHSSVARDLLGGLFTALGAQVIALGRTESFVPIDTEALTEEAIEQAKMWADQIGFDLLVSTDGDGDRPLIADENGVWLRGDSLGVIAAQYLGIEHVVTPVSSNTNAELSGAFNAVTRSRIGSPYVLEAMSSAAQSAKSVAGYEANGGFLLGTEKVLDNGKHIKVLPTRDAVLPKLALLGLSVEQDITVSEVMAELPKRFTASDRLQNIDIEKVSVWLSDLERDSESFINQLGMGDAALVHMDKTDGLRLTLSNNDIVHLRPSGNAPELRCYTESSSIKNAQALCQKALDVIQNNLVIK